MRFLSILLNNYTSAVRYLKIPNNLTSQNPESIAVCILELVHSHFPLKSRILHNSVSFHVTFYPHPCVPAYNGCHQTTTQHYNVTASMISLLRNHGKQWTLPPQLRPFLRYYCLSWSKTHDITTIIQHNRSPKHKQTDKRCCWVYWWFVYISIFHPSSLIIMSLVVSNYNRVGSW